MVLLAHIRDQNRLSLGSYGRPRMTEELNELGMQVGQRRGGRLMRQNGKHVVRSRKFKRTTDSDHVFNIAPNLLLREFAASGPNQQWVGDITFAWTREGWVDLAVILGVSSRCLVVCAISYRMKQDLALRTMDVAIAIPRPPSGCINSTDCESQYCAHDHQKLLRRHEFKVSMSGKNNCYGNSANKSLFKAVKAELVWRRNWQIRNEVEVDHFERINGFYSPRRRQPAVGWKSPLAFEQRAAQHKHLTGTKSGQVLWSSNPSKNVASFVTSFPI